MNDRVVFKKIHEGKFNSFLNYIWKENRKIMFSYYIHYIFCFFLCRCIIAVLVWLSTTISSNTSWLSCVYRWDVADFDFVYLLHLLFLHCLLFTTFYVCFSEIIKPRLQILSVWEKKCKHSLKLLTNKFLCLMSTFVFAKVFEFWFVIVE